MITIHVTEADRERADRVVARRFPEAGRKRIAALFAAGKVRIGGRVAKKGETVLPGTTIEVAEPPGEPAALPDPGVPLAILYNDPFIVAVDKPAGTPSQPIAPGEMGTVANALVARFPECATVSDDPREAGLIHRLDIGTSGVLVAAKTRTAWTQLRKAFASGRVKKRYLAVVSGPLPDSGHSHQALAHHGKKMIVTSQKSGLAAETEWTVRSRAGDFALVDCTANTGRMHQIRVHLAHAGAPIVGDTLYGGPAAPEDFAGHFLHAAEITLPHPDTKQPITITAPRVRFYTFNIS